jgi:hypothetical protein
MKGKINKDFSDFTHYEYNNLLNKTLPELMRQKEQKRELDEL